MNLENTNVTSLLSGRGVIKDLGKNLGTFIITTMDIPWQITKEILGGHPEMVIMVESMEERWLEEILKTLPECDTVVGIGGGQAIDMAKYISWKKGIRLVSIPTILSVDAFVTPAAGIRRNHEVAYVGSSSPNPLVIDFDILRTAPPELNIAGIGDLLSIHTACFDWEWAEKKGKSEYPFSKADISKGRQILENLYSKLDDIRNNTDDGLMAIVFGYMEMNTICLPAGHYRIEEGSEHFLFYELEERLGRPFIHGYIIGLGIYLLSQIQNNDFDKIKKVMDTVGLKYHPVGLKIHQEDLLTSLLNLKKYVQSKPGLWYSVIDDSCINEADAIRIMEGLKF
jgi:glycerol-1-phosphate dehydrogenase [NAD(P)+]